MNVPIPFNNFAKCDIFSRITKNANFWETKPNFYSLTSREPVPKFWYIIKGKLISRLATYDRARLSRKYLHLDTVPNERKFIVSKYFVSWPPEIQQTALTSCCWRKKRMMKNRVCLRMNKECVSGILYTDTYSIKDKTTVEKLFETFIARWKFSTS